MLARPSEAGSGRKAQGLGRKACRPLAGWRSEVGGLPASGGSEVGRQKAEDRGQKAEDRGLMSDVGCRRSDVGGQVSGFRFQG